MGVEAFAEAEHAADLLPEEDSAEERHASVSRERGCTRLQRVYIKTLFDVT